MPPKGEVDPSQRTVEFGLAGAAVVGMGTLLVVAPNALANDTSSAEVEKQALAAFGSNAITRTIESFPAPQTQASTLEIGRTASSGAETEAARHDRRRTACARSELRDVRACRAGASRGLRRQHGVLLFRDVP